MRLIGIPIRGFAGAKARLAPVLPPAERAALARRLATRTVRVARECGRVVVATASGDVAEWAAAEGAEVVADRPGGLDGAASAIVEAAAGGPWAVLHADLPLLTEAELASALEGADRAGAVIAPSFDGGTALLGAGGPFAFSYGPGSFHRHLRQIPEAAVATGPGLAIDLDRPADLRHLR